MSELLSQCGAPLIEELPAQEANCVNGATSVISTN